tara:strand:+ start:816 stop:1019 length:204 start_codon:yes stop_codon:yes gene_type:complete
MRRWILIALLLLLAPVAYAGYAMTVTIRFDGQAVAKIRYVKPEAPKEITLEAYSSGKRVTAVYHRVR